MEGLLRKSIQFGRSQKIPWKGQVGVRIASDSSQTSNASKPIAYMAEPLWSGRGDYSFREFSSSSVDDHDDQKTQETVKQTVVSKWDGSKKYWLAANEYVGVIVGKEASGGEYVISDGVIGPGGFVPDHYHKWEDQTFHVITGELEAKIGDETYLIGQGDSIHCPRGVSHFIKNVGTTEAKLLSCIFPGHWAEEFMAETSRQNHEGKHDRKLIEEKFGVVYV